MTGLTQAQKATLLGLGAVRGLVLTYNQNNAFRRLTRVTYISLKTLTKEDFLSQYQDNPRYELADGELIDTEPTGPHETVSGKLATQIGIYLVTEQLPWFIPRTCLIYPFADAATARRPDVVVLDETVLDREPLWEREPVITLFAIASVTVY